MRKNYKSLIKVCSLVLIMSVGYRWVNAQSITVNTTDYKQAIEIIGGDMERSSMSLQTSVLNKDDVIQWGFGDIHYNYCRVEFDKNQELIEGVNNWAFYDRQVLTMQEVKAISPDIKFWAVMRSDYDGYGDENNMPDWIVNYETREVEEDKYAIFLADYLEFMHNSGVTIHTLSTVKEWSSFVNGTVSRDIILKLTEECTNRGIPMPEINDASTWSMAAGLNFINQVEDLETADLYSGFCSHEYASNDTPEEEWPNLVAKAASIGKKIFQDETITGASLDGITPPLFRYAQRAVLYQSGLSGEVMFEIWSRGLDNEIRSIYWKRGGSASRLNGHYVAKHFTNNVLHSRYITSTSTDVIGGEFSATQYGGITKMAFRKDDTVILWVMNQTSAALATVDYPDFTIYLENGEFDGDIEHMFWNTGSAIEGTEASFTPTGKTSFEVSILENSINVFSFNVKDAVTTPTISTQDIEVKLGANGRVSILPSDIDNGSTDNAEFSLSLDQWIFNCSHLGENTVNLTLTDYGGHSLSATAKVTVVDDIAPTVMTQDITVNLEDDGSINIEPEDVDNGSTDNCGIESLSLDVSEVLCTSETSSTVYLTATDPSGNSAMGTATVTIVDEIAPTVLTKNISIELDDLGLATITPEDVDNGTFDNCDFGSY